MTAKNSSLITLSVLGLVLSGVALAGTASRREVPPSGPTRGALPYEEAVPSSDEIYGWIETIVRQGNRRAGHPADRWVERYGQERFAELGLEDITLQPVQVNRWDTGETVLTVDRGGAKFSFPAFPFAYGDWWTTVEAPLVRYRGPADLDKVKGKIVVVDYPLSEGGPVYQLDAATHVYDPDKTLLDTFHTMPLASRSESGPVVSEILKHGPAAVVAVLSNYFDSPWIVGSHHHGLEKEEFRIPCVWLSPNDGETLELWMAHTPLTASLRVEARTEPVTTHNLMGTLPGASEEVILVGSHHDAQFDSAMEDGSGIALVLAQAAYWSRVPRHERPHTMVFLWSSAHLVYSMGTRILVRTSQDFLDTVLLDVHLEHAAVEHSIGEGHRLVREDRPEPRWIYTSRIPVLEEAVIAAVHGEDLRRTMVLPPDIFGPFPSADSGPIHYAGVPVASFLSAPAFLLDAADTLDKVDREGLEPITRAMIRVIWAMKGQTAAGMRAADIQRGSDERPTYVRNREHILRFDASGDGALDGAELEELRRSVAVRHGYN